MKKRHLATMCVAAVGAAALLTACSEEIKAPAESKSGYTFAQPETKAMQDDDFVNPGMLVMSVGEAEWSKVAGKAGKSCASCHGDAKEMRGVAATYPKYDPVTKKPLNLELRINACRTRNMQADAYKFESPELLGITTYVKYQSRGMPINVKVDGEMAPFLAKGKEFYYQRRGLLDLACKHCHEDGEGKNIRANLLSQGHINGFPTYRLKWQKVGSLHRRLRGCNSQVRSEPYGFGSDEFVNLEVFLSWRSRGLPIETPSVRN